MNFIKINAKEQVNLDLVKKLEITEDSVKFIFTIGERGDEGECVTELKANMPKSAIRKLESDFE